MPIQICHQPIPKKAIKHSAGDRFAASLDASIKVDILGCLAILSGLDYAPGTISCI